VGIGKAGGSSLVETVNGLGFASSVNNRLYPIALSLATSSGVKFFTSGFRSLVRGLPCSGISGIGVCSQVGFVIAGKISSGGFSMKMVVWILVLQFENEKVGFLGVFQFIVMLSFDYLHVSCLILLVRGMGMRMKIKKVSMFLVWERLDVLVWMWFQVGVVMMKMVFLCLKVLVL
jgi:hypothetical protein